MMEGENGKMGIKEVMVGKEEMDKKDRRKIEKEKVINLNEIELGKGGRRRGNGNEWMDLKKKRRGEERRKKEGEKWNK